MSEATYKGASKESLQHLHGLLLQAILAEFERSATTGEPLTAAFMGVVRCFLRDNNVAVDGASAADLQRSLGELRALGLPFIAKEPK